MNFPRLVCPNVESLLGCFAGFTIVVRVDDLGDAAAAAASVREGGSQLLCVIFETDRPLAEIAFPADLEDVPLAVMAPSLGLFRDLARRLDALRAYNLRVYLPCDDPENVTGLRILSSIGVHGCAVFGKDAPDWDALTDLMTYALLGRFPHASIEPFTHIAANYDPTARLDWGSVYFDDPDRFLHLDADGRVALSPAELREGSFVARSASEIEAPAAFPAIRQRRQAWKAYFVDGHGCAACPSWRACLGRVSAHLSENDGCRDFFAEMIEVAGQYKTLNEGPEEARIWQP